MEKDDAVALFAQTYFGGVENGVQQSLNRFCRFHRFERDQMLFYEQQNGQDAYFLASGSVKLCRTNSRGKEIAITFVIEGQLFAWLALQSEAYYPVSAVCLKTSTLLSFDLCHTGELLGLNPRLSQRMLAYLANRQPP